MSSDSAAERSTPPPMSAADAGSLQRDAAAFVDIPLRPLASARPVRSRTFTELSGRNPGPASTPRAPPMATASDFQGANTSVFTPPLLPKASEVSPGRLYATPVSALPPPFVTSDDDAFFAASATYSPYPSIPATRVGPDGLSAPTGMSMAGEFPEPIRLTRTRTASTVRSAMPHDENNGTLTIHALPEPEVAPERPPSTVQEDMKSRTGDIDEHKLTLKQLAERYSTRINYEAPKESHGLKEKDVPALTEKYGLNRLKPPKKTPTWVLFLHEFKNPLTVLLIIAGVLTFALYFIDTSIIQSLYLAVVLIIVTFLNALIDFVQVRKSQAILESFKDLVPAKTLVVRDGKVRSDEAQSVFPGDLVILREGDKVPADVRLIWVNNVKVDNSSLTGESEPQTRAIEANHDSFLEAQNLAFSGTIVTSGEGYGIVIRTGDRTVLGQIAGLASGSPLRPSPLAQEIADFVKLIAIFATFLAIVFLIVSVIIKPNFTESFMLVIGVFVANIPQGLPATVTLLLSFAARRMASRNVLVKDLQAVDTLGGITMLCSDKTGTITQNKMTVVNTWLSGAYYTVGDGSGNKTNGNGRHEENGSGQTLVEMTDAPHTQHDTTPAFLSFDANENGFSCDQVEVLRMASLCSRARFTEDDENMAKPVSERHVIGDATETGLLRFAAARFDYAQESRRMPKEFEVPFNSVNKWALSIHILPDTVSQEQASVYGESDASRVLYIKGAPERIIAKCSMIRIGGKTEILTDEHHKQFERAYECFAAKGERVLAFAFLPLQRSQFGPDFEFTREPPNYPTSDYIFLGLVGIMDPPKAKVAQAVASCQSAGVQVMMITGDHPLTAESIARQIGLIIGKTKNEVAAETNRRVEDIGEDEYRAVVVHGDKIDDLSNADWNRILAKKEVVFARTSPKQKLEIVTRCQALGHVVACSGDGVNDSPAIRRADLGISMSITGSDVSKEAAKLILLDDNFSTIVEGIAEGRLIFANLKKSIQYTLTHIMPELVPFLLFLIGGLPVPLTSMLVLFIDLGTELGPALSFAYEAEESDLMQRPPRREVVPPAGLLALDRRDALELARVPSFRVEEFKAAQVTDMDEPAFYAEDMHGVPPIRRRLGYLFSRNLKRFKRSFIRQSAATSDGAGADFPKIPTMDSQDSANFSIARPSIVSTTGTRGIKRTNTFASSTAGKRKGKKNWWRRGVHRARKFFTVGGFYNKGDERLVDRQLLSWSYLQAGIIETLVCLFMFFFIFGVEGIAFWSLFGTTRDAEWGNLKKPVNVGGITYSAKFLNDTYREATSAYFLGVVLVQAYTAIVCKSLHDYPIGRRLLLNKKTYLGILFAFAFASLIIYTPGIHTIAQSHSVRGYMWGIGLAGGFLLYMYELARRVLYRHHVFGLGRKRVHAARQAAIVEGIGRTLTREKKS